MKNEYSDKINDLPYLPDNKNIIKKFLDDKDKYDDELIIIIQDFILKFPHIKVSIEPEPKQ